MLIKLDDDCWMDPEKVVRLDKVTWEDKPACKVHTLEDWVIAEILVDEIAEIIERTLVEQEKSREESCLSLRDHTAVEYMKSICGNEGAMRAFGRMVIEDLDAMRHRIAFCAYQMADAMLKARKEKQS